LKSLFDRFFAFMGSIVADGGPSSTRWVFLRTAEVVSFGWVALVVSVAYRYWKFGTSDGAMLTAIVTLAGALFGFATQTQNNKISTDAKVSGMAGEISTTPLSGDVKG
jgi:hypothetical protein